MREIEDFSDARQKAWCIHCGKALSASKVNRDHVPTRSLLLNPDADDLPVTFVCQACNESFSLSEQYFVALLNTVLCGSANPRDHSNPKSAAILRGDKKLRRKLRNAERQEADLFGQTRTIWQPDRAMLIPAVVKNARGHIYYEWGEPKFGEPTNVFIKPVSNLTSMEASFFGDQSMVIQPWPEVGSRAMTRLVEGQDMMGSWVIVEHEWYRYRVLQRDGLAVQMIVAEYLAIDVVWEE